MMFSYIFILEAKNDVVFLKDFILENYNNFIVSKEKAEDEFWLKNDNIFINIRSTKSDDSKSGGWNNFGKLIETSNFNKMLNSATEVIIIFDADEDKQHNIEHKKAEITKWVNAKFKIDTFFVPFNDEKSIDLEQLLELCILDEDFINCYDGFKNCINGSGKTIISKNKGMIMTYRENYPNNNQGYSSNYWKINAEENSSLEIFKEFLDKYLT